MSIGKNVEILSSETKDSYQTFLCVHSVRKLWPLSSEGEKNSLPGNLQSTISGEGQGRETIKTLSKRKF